MDTDRKTYDDLMRIKRERQAREAIQNAGEWWRSLDASQKEAGFATWKWKITPAVFIKVPVPFGGLVDVVYVGMGGRSSERKKPNGRQLEWLRECVRNPNGDLFLVERKNDSVTMLWKPQALANGETLELGVISYGFITVA